MRPISKEAQRILDHLVRDLEVGGERKLDNGGTAIMAVHVLRRSEKVYSIAHFYVQNGDMMADPEIDYWLGPDGRFYPCTYRQDSLGINSELIVLEEDDKVTGHRPKGQRDAATFTTTWMRNIKDQQGIQL